MAHRFRPRIERLPAVRFDTGTVRLFASLTQVLAQSGEAVNRRLDAKAQEQGRTAGIKAGTTGSVENVPLLQDAATLRGRAFNAAAITTFTARLESTSRQRINDMFIKNAANPEELEKSLEAYQMGVSMKLAQMIPEVGAAFDANFPIWSQPFINKASNAAFKQAVATAKRAVAVREEQLGKDLLAIGADLSDPDPNIQTAAMNAIIAQRAAIEVVLGQVDPRTGAPFFPADTANAIRKKNDDAIKKSWVRGWYGKQTNKSAAYLKWRRGQVRIPLVQPDGTTFLIDPRADFDFKDEQELDSFMKTQRDVETTIERQAQDDALTIFKRGSEEVLRRMRVAQVEGVQNQTLIRLLDENKARMTAADLKAGLAMTRNADVSDDPDYIQLINDQLDAGMDPTGTITLGLATQKLTTGTASTYFQRGRNITRLLQEENPIRLGHQMLSVNFGRDAEFTNNPRFKLALNQSSLAAKQQFDNWITKVKEQRDGNLPDVDEVIDKVRRITLGHLPPKAARAFFGAQVERPRGTFVVPHRAQGPLRGFVDVNATRQNLLNQIELQVNEAAEDVRSFDDIDIDEMPADLVEQIRILRDYEEAQDEYLTIQALQAAEGLERGEEKSTGTTRTR